MECKNLNIFFSQPKWIKIDKWENWESIYKWRGRQKYKNVTQQAFQSNNCKKKNIKKKKFCIESGHTGWSVYMYMYIFFGIHFKQISFLFWLSFWFRKSQTTETMQHCKYRYKQNILWEINAGMSLEIGFFLLKRLPRCLCIWHKKKSNPVTVQYTSKYNSEIRFQIAALWQSSRNVLSSFNSNIYAFFVSLSIREWTRLNNYKNEFYARHMD